MNKSLLFLLPAFSACQSDKTNVTVESIFTLSDNQNSDPGLSEFKRVVEVMGLHVYGEDGVSDTKLLYAANVWAELLDNDEDGAVDDMQILGRLQSQSALMPIFSSEGSSVEEDFMENYRGEGVSAVLYNGEVDPSQPGHWGADATIEEIMHTINAVGHVNVYPDAFSLAPNSSRLTDAMDVARGGQFLSVPSSYPDESWYHYDDVTCDYECMAIEYIYWAQVSNMEILNDPETCEGIANEWEPCSRDLLQSMDTLIYALVTDPEFKLPQFAPDGKYSPPE